MQNVLKTWRTQEKKLTREVAEAIGVTPAMWSRWETGKRKVPPPQARKIEAVLGIPKEQTAPEVYAPRDAKAS
jgi:transcriptional regulator with XRE-family HTH domain